jgi:hypothetical protein
MLVVRKWVFLFMHSKNDFSKFSGNAFDSLVKNPISKGIFTTDQSKVILEEEKEEKKEE